MPRVKYSQEVLDKVVVGKESTDNHKTGPMAITYVSGVTCPRSCPLFSNGCYAKNYPMGAMSRRLDEAAERRGMSALDVAKEEAAVIRSFQTRRPLRIHGYGDSPTAECANTVAEACVDFMDAGGGQAFGYTHAWEWVGRENWLSVSMLASCESLQAADVAMQAGYAAAIVVDKFRDGPRAWVDEETGIKVIPCPSQSKEGVTCTTCKMCMNDTSLRERRAVIAFEAHGARATSVKAVVRSINCGSDNELAQAA